jgi:hypothetical protein
MMDFMKMAVLGAALSYAAMSAYEQPMQKLEAALARSDQDKARLGDERAEAAARPATIRPGALRVSAVTRSSDVAPVALVVDR